MATQPKQSTSVCDSLTDSAPDEYVVGKDSDVTPEISIVLPTLNEEKGVAECITDIKAALAEMEMVGEIIVSDSSTDKTPEIAESMGAIVVTPDVPGYGYAYRYAFAQARGEYVAMGDADTTYDFQDLPRLFEKLVNEDADLVMGSRLEGEIKPDAMPKLHQYIGNTLLTKCLNVFYGSNVSDAHSGFRLFRQDALEQLDLRSDGMEFASEMLVEAISNDLHIVEVPITYHEREGEATLESFSDGWRHVRFMLLNAPPNLFLFPAVVSVAMGVFVFTLAYTNIQFGSTSFGIHSMIAASLLTIVGIELTSLGLFADLISPLKKRPQSRITQFAGSQFKLKHGTMSGIVLFGAGGLYALFLAYDAYTSGFSVIPLLQRDLIAFVAIVVGIQITFNSLFFEMLRYRSDH
jgi:glycosyltransferase involved in cell wall biosynthesis